MWKFLIGHLNFLILKNSLDYRMLKTPLNLMKESDLELHKNSHKQTRPSSIMTNYKTNKRIASW